MKKTVIFFLAVLVISNNILLFVYGLARKSASDKASEAAQASYLLDSAYVLARHDYEDTGGRAFDEKEAKLWEGDSFYSVKDIDEKTAFMKIKVMFRGEVYTREYVLRK